MAEARFLPKRLVKEFDNESNYPTVARTTGLNATGKDQVHFDDTNTIVYSEGVINFPTTFSNNLLPNSLPEDFYSTQLSANGTVISYLNDQWVHKNLHDKSQLSTQPFVENGQFDDIFFESGSFNLPSPISSKTCVTIKLPIPQQNFLTGSYNRILTLSPGTISSEGGSYAGWQNTNIPVSTRTIQMEGAAPFDVFGNPISPTFNEPFNEYGDDYPIIDAILRKSFNRNDVVSLLENSKIELKNYISHPFAVEKVAIQFYGKATNGWINSVTALTTSNEEGSLPFLIGGSAITVGLGAYNSGYYNLFFSGTIVSTNDAISTQEKKFFDVEGGLDLVFPRGFNRWACPNFIFPNTTDITKIVVQGDCTVSNGLIGLGFAAFNTTQSFDRLPKYQDEVSFFVCSGKQLGRSNNGYSSGRSIFANEYVLPENSISKFNEETGEFVFYSHLHNLYKSISSPYIVFPDEHLALTISKYLPCPIENNTSEYPDDKFYIGGDTSPNISYGSGNYYYNLNETNYITIKLYGSLITLQKENQDLTNSYCVSNSIHETVDNSKITDAWDCNPYDLLSGSMLSLIRVPYSDGTFNRESIVRTLNCYYNNYDSNEELKKILASDGDSEFFYDKSLTYRNFREIAPRKKTIETVCKGEYYLDSVVPSIQDIFDIRGKNISKFKCGSMKSAIILKSFYNETYDTSKFTNLEDYSLSDWSSSFPFAGLNSGARRVFLNKLTTIGGIILEESEVEYGFTTSDESTIGKNVSIIIANDLLPLTGEDTLLGCYGEIGVVIIPPDTTIESGNGLSVRDFNKILFGFNTSPGVSDYPRTRSSVTKDLIWNNEGASISNVKINLCPEIRGWKYGLSHGIPMQTKCHWNPKHYGHFRDMFEQRQFTAFYYENDIVNDNKYEAQPAVFVKFVNPQTQESALPEATNSGNITNHNTSNLPFFDGLFVDRTYNQNTIQSTNVVFANRFLSLES